MLSIDGFLTLQLPSSGLSSLEGLNVGGCCLEVVEGTALDLKQ